MLQSAVIRSLTISLISIPAIQSNLEINIATWCAAIDILTCWAAVVEPITGMCGQSARLVVAFNLSLSGFTHAIGIFQTKSSLAIVDPFALARSGVRSIVTVSDQAQGNSLEPSSNRLNTSAASFTSFSVSALAGISLARGAA